MSMFITQSGEVVVTVFDTLSCKNKNENWLTIADWFSAFEKIEAKITIAGGKIFVTLVDAPGTSIESLLEHFEYQK